MLLRGGGYVVSLLSSRRLLIDLVTGRISLTRNIRH
jgi:hypothetical protein